MFGGRRREGGEVVREGREDQENEKEEESQNA